MNVMWFVQSRGVNEAMELFCEFILVASANRAAIEHVWNEEDQKSLRGKENRI